MLGEDGLGLPVQLLNQSAKAMQAGSERVQDLVKGGQLLHNGDPIARWCGANAQVKYDANLFPKVVKPDPNEQRTKIDAIIALCFAADRWLAWERDGGEHIPEGWLPWDEEEAEEEAELPELVLTRA